MDLLSYIMHIFWMMSLASICIVIVLLANNIFIYVFISCVSFKLFISTLN